MSKVSKAGPLIEYERRIEAGDLVDGDNCQVGTIRELQRLYDELANSAEACQLDWYAASEKLAEWLWSCFIPESSYLPGKVLYLYGGVGTGKTMLMDLFFDQLPSSWRKKRIHFHDFMLDVHSRLQGVTDVADALILNRLFGHLFSNGVVNNLYEGGLQRDVFLPFISILKERCVVHEIGSSTDYRKMTSDELGFYFVGKELTGLLKQEFQHLVGEHKAHPQLVEVVIGRTLQKRFHTLALDGVPIFGLHNRTAAHRFVMYENKARLICTAEGTPVELFEKIVTISDAQQMAPRTSSRSRKNDDLDICVENELGYAKDRTISR
ncbi:unnamed protein product [Camellia sinensis]